MCRGHAVFSPVLELGPDKYPNDDDYDDEEEEEEDGDDDGNTKYSRWPFSSSQREAFLGGTWRALCMSRNLRVLPVNNLKVRCCDWNCPVWWQNIEVAATGLSYTSSQGRDLIRTLWK